jgi:hypothetical protein
LQLDLFTLGQVDCDHEGLPNRRLHFRILREQGNAGCSDDS